MPPGWLDRRARTTLLLASILATAAARAGQEDPVGDGATGAPSPAGSEVLWQFETGG